MATPTDQAIKIHVNGEPREVPGGLTVDQLLHHLDRDPGMPGFAVAVNDAVVRRGEWARATVHGDDRVEIVTASQGG